MAAGPHWRFVVGPAGIGAAMLTFGLVLFWASWDIIRSALRILLQSTPEDFDLDEAIATLRRIGGVKDVHHVHAWSVTSERTLFSAHICVRSFAEDGERVLREASERLKHWFGIYFSTIQIEEECLSGEEDAAAMTSRARALPRHRRDASVRPARRPNGMNIADKSIDNFRT